MERLSSNHGKSTFEMQPSKNDQDNLETRVLLVDDQKDMLRVMQLILARQQNFRVETAESGTQALAKVEVFSPDVVVSDISMPEMDGCELMTQLRENVNLKPFSSIALSGYGSDKEVETLAAGYDVHLIKPVDYDNLTTVINQLVQQKTDISE